MNVYKDITQLPETLSKCIIAMGNFDGAHIGHRELIKSALNESAETNKEFVLLTFSPNPSRHFNPDFRYIHSPSIRNKTFKALGVKNCLEIQFNDTFSKLSPEDFISMISDKLSPSKIITGYNFNFGYKKQGNRETLKQLSSKFNFIYQPIEEIKYHSNVVSSTYIRELIKVGRVNLASKLLSAFFTISGKVLNGSGDSSKILGAPTANISVDFNEIIKPLYGLYFVELASDKTTGFGLANFGHHGIFERKEPELAIHLFNFDGDIKGHDVEVRFISLMRPEHMFSSIDQFKRQIKRDTNHANYLIRNLDSLRPTSE